MDWASFEQERRVTVSGAPAALADANPAERIYSVAFHLFYADGEKVIAPAFAANVESAVRFETWGSTRFDPPEWRWDVIDEASAVMTGRYEELSAELVDHPEVADALLSDHDRSIARVCAAP